MMQTKGIIFPTTNEIRLGREKSRPTQAKLEVTLDQKGVKCDFKSLVKITIDSVIKMVRHKRTYKQQGGDCYKFYFKDGGDGSGQHLINH